MITAAIVTALSLLASDAQGRRPLKPISLKAAEPIAAECEAHPLPDLVLPGEELCAAVYLEHSLRESGWDLYAVGDGGHSFGPFQVQGRAPTSWIDAVRQFSPLLKRASVCEEPLEMLAVGKCGTTIGKTISRSRVLEARRMVVEYVLGRERIDLLLDGRTPEDSSKR